MEKGMRFAIELGLSLLIIVGVIFYYYQTAKSPTWYIEIPQHYEFPAAQD